MKEGYESGLMTETITMEDVPEYRAMCEDMELNMQADQVYVDAFESCHQTEVVIHGNLSVYISTPKEESSVPRAAMVYSHGCGTIGGTAKNSRSYTSHLANLGDIVVFSVEYRRIPEADAN